MNISSRCLVLCVGLAAVGCGSPEQESEPQPAAPLVGQWRYVCEGEQDPNCDAELHAKGAALDVALATGSSFALAYDVPRDPSADVQLISMSGGIEPIPNGFRAAERWDAQRIAAFDTSGDEIDSIQFDVLDVADLLVFEDRDPGYEDRLLYEVWGVSWIFVRPVDTEGRLLAGKLDYLWLSTNENVVRIEVSDDNRMAAIVPMGVGATTVCVRTGEVAACHSVVVCNQTLCPV